MKNESLLDRVKAKNLAHSPERATAASGLMPHRQIPVASTMESPYIAGFVEEPEPCCFPGFSRDGINWIAPEWNTFHELEFLTNAPIQLLILKSKRYRIEIRGHRLRTVTKSVERKKLSYISPSSPASIHDHKKPFIASVEIIRMPED